MDRRSFLAAKCARLSSERVRQFGKLPSEGVEWWKQITSVAEACGLEASWDEWEELRLIDEQRHAKQDGMDV